MQHLQDAVALYIAETRKLDAMANANETTFYPAIKTLLTAILKAERLSFDVITGTSESREKGREQPKQAVHENLDGRIKRRIAFDFQFHKFEAAVRQTVDEIDGCSDSFLPEIRSEA
jgi:hypothetical protein